MIRTRPNATWRVGKRELLAMLAGIVIFAGLSWLTSYAKLADAFGADIRPAVAVPIVFGFIYGPVVGFTTGMFGNMAYDFLAGNIPSPYGTPTGQIMTDAVTMLYINWQIANGLSGLIPGIMATYHRRYRTWGDMGQAIAFMAAGIAIGIGFAAVTDPLFYPEMTLERSINEQWWPIFLHNFLSAMLFVPLVLFNYERLDLRYLISGQWLQSGLLRQITGMIFISAAIPTILLSFFLIQAESGAVTGANSTLGIKLLATITITLIFTVINSVLASQSISRPLLRLTAAARLMQEGQLTLESAEELKESQGNDEVSQLSHVFGNMATEVLARETALKQQVESLRIEVDLVKQQRQVIEITESDFFRDLQVKAKYLRSRESDSADTAAPEAPASASEPATD